MYCNCCRVAYVIRATKLELEDSEDDPDLDPQSELSADYCPFCGQLAEED